MVVIRKVTRVVYFEFNFHSLDGATVTVINGSYKVNNKQLSGYLDFFNPLNCNHYEFVCCKEKRQSDNIF